MRLVGKSTSSRRKTSLKALNQESTAVFTEQQGSCHAGAEWTKGRAKRNDVKEIMERESERERERERRRWRPSQRETLRRSPWREEERGLAT